MASKRIVSALVTRSVRGISPQGNFRDGARWKPESERFVKLGRGGGTVFPQPLGGLRKPRIAGTVTQLLTRSSNAIIRDERKKDSPEPCSGLHRPPSSANENGFKAEHQLEPQNLAPGTTTTCTGTMDEWAQWPRPGPGLGLHGVTGCVQVTAGDSDPWAHGTRCGTRRRRTYTYTVRACDSETSPSARLCSALQCCTRLHAWTLGPSWGRQGTVGHWDRNLYKGFET